jgi:hypothetical protein
MTDLWNENIETQVEIAQHVAGEIRGRKIILPNSINSETINPKNFIELKDRLDINELLIIDRLKGVDDIVSIIDHINRSGQNYLRSKTPEGPFPQFPDMSKVYNNIDGLKGLVVHTIGEERFLSAKIVKEIVWSEYAGLIVPVAHYVGIKVSALGSENIDNIIIKL